VGPRCNLFELLDKIQYRLGFFVAEAQDKLPYFFFHVNFWLDVIFALPN
jgi:hypothetical protein